MWYVIKFHLKIKNIAQNMHEELLGMGSLPKTWSPGRWYQHCIYKLETLKISVRNTD